VDSLPRLTDEQRDLLAMIFRSRHHRRLPRPLSRETSRPVMAGEARAFPVRTGAIPRRGCGQASGWSPVQWFAQVRDASDTKMRRQVIRCQVTIRGAAMKMRAFCPISVSRRATRSRSPGKLVRLAPTADTGAVTVREGGAVTVTIRPRTSRPMCDPGGDPGVGRREGP
jgi:hypothetical protein